MLAGEEPGGVGALGSSVRRVETRVFSIPIPTGFRGLTVREGMLLRGPAGWGEFSPFPEYDAEESVSWLLSARESTTLADPEPVRERVPVNSIVPALAPAAAAQMALAAGCGTVKVKVAAHGESLDHNKARVAAIREALPDVKIRIDANGAWDVKHAVKAIRALDDLVGLEYVEQPCAEVTDLAAVRRDVGTLIAADESIRRAADPFRVRDLEAADIAVLKVQPLGGIRACLRIAQQIELPVVVSSAVETSIGLATGVALAAALPELPYACGLGTATLLRGDAVAQPLLPVNGELPITRPKVDKEAFALIAASERIHDRWDARLRHVEEMLDD